jgi:hypothetical protein
MIPMHAPRAHDLRDNAILQLEYSVAGIVGIGAGPLRPSAVSM